MAGEGGDFSFSVVDDFDAHIAREIHGYSTLDQLVRGIAEASIEDGTRVYDLGCSTGRLLNTLAVTVESEVDPSRRKEVEFIGIEPNENFVRDFEPATQSVEIQKDRVTRATVLSNASLITSLFTIQFVPVQERQAILTNIYNGLNLNGVFIWAEKVHARNSRVETLLNGQHLDLKREGSSAEDILDKDQRLRAIMHPLDESTNRSLLRRAGFSDVETFWRVNNFMALIAVKSAERDGDAES